MTELIIPGTYIDVRAEGLIASSGVSTGIIGVVGTACSGPLDTPISIASYAEARETFGLPDAYQAPEDSGHPLTLTRALQLVYGNGASQVVAVRVASPRRAHATYALKDTSDREIAMLKAATPGTWANRMQISVTPATTPGSIRDERTTSGFTSLRKGLLPSPQNRLQVLRGTSRRIDTFDLIYGLVYKQPAEKDANGNWRLPNFPIAQVADINRITVTDHSNQTTQIYGAGSEPIRGAIRYGDGTIASQEVRINTTTGVLTFGDTIPADATISAVWAVQAPEPGPGQVRITTWDGMLTFHLEEGPKAANNDVLIATYLVDASSCVQITLTSGQISETYVVPDGPSLMAAAVSSRLITVTADPASANARPRTGVKALFGTGSNLCGSDGADADAVAYGKGLDALSNMDVNIVLLAGQDAAGMGSLLAQHLKSTAANDLERMGVIGAPGVSVQQFLNHAVSDERMVVVAPGITAGDHGVLPPAYTAAAVAGLIASQRVQTSLTNKTVNVPSLALSANRGEQAQLLEGNLLTLVNKEGIRVLKGITSAGAGEPFAAIATRRIVDFAKRGVRTAANPYLGRLNNSRVRGALKASLDAFLTGMVQDEALTGYTLDVSATRSQEIAGQVNVIMTLQPTFSIDFIRVVMTLH